MVVERKDNSIEDKKNEVNLLLKMYQDIKERQKDNTSLYLTDIEGLSRELSRLDTNNSLLKKLEDSGAPLMTISIELKKLELLELRNNFVRSVWPGLPSHNSSDEEKGVIIQTFLNKSVQIFYKSEFANNTASQKTIDRLTIKK